MTNKFNRPTTVPVTKEHAEIRRWAITLQSLTAEHPELDALAKKLKLIGEGADASEVLGTKRRRGHSDSGEAALFRANLALTWIAGAMNSEDESGYGFKFGEACIKASEAFGIEADNLKRYWAARHKTIVPTLGEFTFDDLLPSRSRKKPQD